MSAKMDQDKLVKDAVLLDPNGVEHVIHSIETSAGADHSGWRYTLKVGKRKMKSPLSFATIESYFTLKEEKKPVRRARKNASGS